MAQFTRGQLKSLVKECLVEILSEGLLTSDKRQASSNIQERRQDQPRLSTPLRSNSPALNSVVFGSGQKQENLTRASTEKSAPRFENAVKEHISALTSDPIMSQIFADTASSTLQDQIYAERGQGRPNLETENAPDPVTDSFLSESAKNWASLAFSDQSKSR